MKLFTALIGFVSISCYAEDTSHWSAGIGSNYGGIGVKYSQPVNTYVDLYANLGQSAGFSLLSYRNGISASVGSEVAFTNNQRHTLNAAIAILDAADLYHEYSKTTDKNRLSGYVFGYTYYFSGLHSTGQALGVSTIRLTDDDEILTSLSISWGYKF
jgi:hypothetical protein